MRCNHRFPMGMLRGLLAVSLLGRASLPSLYGETRWYASNAAGMALERAFRALALRGKYALAVDALEPDALPGLLRAYYVPGYQVEIHILYEQGKVSRRRWLFKDGRNRVRVVAAFNAEAPLEESPAVAPESPVAVEPKPDEPLEQAEPAAVETGTAEGEEAAEPEPPDHAGLIEIYTDQGLLLEDHHIDPDGTDRFIRYQYSAAFLIRAETRIKRPGNAEGAETIEDYCTDYYRYSRSNALRSVERVFHNPEGGAAGESPQRLRFPHSILGIEENKDFVSPVSAYSADFLQDSVMEAGHRIVYTTDERGRVLTETWKDESGDTLGVLRNTWSGNRITSIHWNSGEDERLTEYEYNAEGDRIVERNYTQGVLERVVRRDGEREVEELYMEGKVALRAVWEQGRKITEERISGGSAASPEAGKRAAPAGGGAVAASRAGSAAGFAKTPAAASPKEPR